MNSWFASLVVFALGLLEGSFVGLCAYRIPRGESVVLGRSHCDHCRSPLRWLYKLPLASYLMLGGHTRCCGQTISLRYPILEMATGMSFVLIYWQVPASADFLPIAVLLGLLAAGMLIDLDYKIIPDKVSLTGMALGLLLVRYSSQVGLEGALLGILVCGGFLYMSAWLTEAVFRKSNSLGGGDIKFAAMIGAFLGWQQGLVAIMLASFAGTAFGLFQMIANRDLQGRREIRFGPFLALGAVVSLIWGNFLP
ncbi:MAG: prepilin peptidase, partial [bacterium]